jgi:hypothetical protein
VADAKTPRIAILGWGSLLWEGGTDFDKWRDEWRFDGPTLRLEFSRVSTSRLGALTLVIDLKHGSETTVAWCLSKRKNPDDAAVDLRCREGCSIRDIGRHDLLADENTQPQGVALDIAAWARAQNVDVVIWTALASNFESKAKRPFAVAEAVVYVQRLPPEAKSKAAEYIWRAPDFVGTPLRTALQQGPWFRGQGR